MSVAEIVKRESQRDFVRRCRAESFLDKRVPLGIPTMNPRVEAGPSIKDFFRQKHRRGERGRFWPLHLVSEKPSKSW